VTSAAFGTCGDCNRLRKADAIFCECGALLDYSAPTEGRTNGTTVALAPAPKPTPASESESESESEADRAGERSAESHEWPPARYEAPREHTKTEQPGFRVRECPHCKALNPTQLLVCWHCNEPMIVFDEAEDARRRRWWRLYRRERAPLPAGEHERTRDPRGRKELLQAGLITAGVLLLGAVLVIAAIKTWHPAYHNSTRLYNASRERLFPRFTPHHPSSVWPPQSVTLKKGTTIKRKNGKSFVLKSNTEITLKHPAADAFDRDLSTYWLSRTPRQVWDNLRINFKPAIGEFNDVVVFGGDPTAKTIVPKRLQMTFFRWEPHPDLVAGPVEAVHRPGDPVVLRSGPPEECKAHSPVRLPLLRPSRGQFCVLKDGIKVFELLNTPAGQRFSIGTQKDVAKIVITVRGTHRSTLPHAHAALTDIEFFDRH